MKNETNSKQIKQIYERNILLKCAVLFVIVYFCLSLVGCKKDTPTPGGGTTPGTPIAPRTITASPDDGKDSIAWSQVLDASAVTKYNVYGSTTSGYTGKLIGSVDASNALTYSFVHNGLVNGTTWYYYVAAVNVNGEGTKSAEVSATPNIPMSKTSSLMIQQYLPAVVQAAPFRYYDPTNAEYGNIPAAKTDTFKLWVSSRVIAGHDISIFSQSGANRGAVRPTDVVLATFPEKNYAFKAGVDKSKHKQVEQWQWQGGTQFYTLGKNTPYVDTLPVVFKISGLKSINNVKSAAVRVTEAESWWTDYQAFGVPVNYEKTLNLADFTQVEGWAKWDKTKNTVFHVGSDYYFVVPARNQQQMFYNFEIRVEYADGSATDQMMVYYFQSRILQ